MKIKRTLSILLMLTLSLGLLAACGRPATPPTQESVAVQPTQPTPEETTTDTTTTEDQTESDATVESTEDTADSEENSESAGVVDTYTKLNVEIAALKGPTAIGMVQVMENAEAGATANNYNFTLAGAADEITPKIISGEIHMAAVPCNLASVLYNKSNGGVKMAAINVTSVLYIVETGDTIQSVEDLKGKTIYSTGKGTTPEYTLNQLLLSAGIDPLNDVTIEYKSEASEVAAILAEAEDAIAMLPQPFVTTAMMQNDRIRIALDINAEWEARNENSSVVTGVLVVNSQFAADHPEAVEAFLEEYQSSVDFVNDNVEEAATLVEKAGIVKAAVAAKAIPYCNVVLIRGEEMEQKASAYLNVLFEQNPNAVGGTLPAEDFYLR